MLQEEDTIIILYCAISDDFGREDYKHPQAHFTYRE